MKTPITYRLPGQSTKTIPKTGASRHFGDRISYTKAELIVNEKAEIYSQSYSCPELFLELKTFIVSNAPIIVNCRPLEPIWLFSFALQGRITFLDSQNKEAALLPAGRYAGIQPSGTDYQLQLNKGRHLLLNMALSKELASAILPGLTALYKLILEAENQNKELRVLPICQAGYSVHRILRKLKALPSDHVAIRLTRHALNLLLQYEMKLPPGSLRHMQAIHQKALEARDYIEQHYLEADCSVTKLAEYFGCTRKSLSREYQKTFNIGIKEDITRRRMNFALQLLTKDGKSVGQAASAIGYSDSYSFSKAFKKHFGYPPMLAKIR